MQSTSIIPESSALAISETVSEIKPKAKRGRPKSFACLHAEGLERSGLGLLNAHSKRAKVDYAHRMAVLSAIRKAGEETQTRVFGFTLNDVMLGTHYFPPGYDTAATEIGRWIATHDALDEEKHAAIEIVTAARDEGISWADIRAHFRNLRLGEKQGNALSLFAHLARAYDEYIRNFPATTQDARIGGINNLLDAVENPE
jgi:hypothetical protein